MLQMNNHEPRRFWARSTYSPFDTDLENHDDGLCVSCGRLTDTDIKEPMFCASCREWSRQRNLDEYYDDLGVAG